MKRKIEESNSANCFNCELCEFLTQSRIQLNIHMVNEHEHLDQLDGYISLNSATVEENVKEAIVEKESVPFSECKQYATGKIPKSYMKIHLPKSPPAMG